MRELAEFVKLDVMILVSKVRIWFLGIAVRIYDFILERMGR